MLLIGLRTGEKFQMPDRIDLSELEGLSMLSLCRKVGAPVLLAALVIVQGLVYAGPCYQRSGGNLGCYAQGGPECQSLTPIPYLPCDGEWSAGELAELGWYSGWPCQVKVIVHSIPKNYATSGNEQEGFMEQSFFLFPCSSERTCFKRTTFYSTIICEIINTTPCTYFSVFTAGGADCPDSSG